ncbi:sigma-70 family RNA polymerase sigma factor [Macrococcoides canis]|uniref:sigma-70 family RNA polymerase sigma factor n=1 Tax=Macrococcoides canis TaxID=1855823 RepID=UPI0010FC08F0|nr:sigma-70 family RNA polymerase sigma factor [Macrococcus canis]MCO4096814.1 sigma-70 family RNA polymerase sigma factor [Macrococcus canis]QCT74049.1 sigma-70 family RNA polymerase sigma factor [Macrococcus canis]QNR07058.1 sigma-70 family RNA polymerase sigma factor [Macrococcus canis]UTH09603.1 sigma-70 family RNA polymerase sigma factor [Macrococcus canis]
MNDFDASIIRKIKHRNEHGIELLLKRYGGLIKSIAKHNLYLYETHIEECINDVLIAIWNNIDSYNPEKSSFKNWIGVITKYHAIDTLRKHSRYTYNQLDSAKNEGVKDKYEIYIDELWQELIEPLSSDDKEIMTRIFIEGYSPDEVAHSMNKNTSNIYNRISRAKEKIRKLKGDSL